MNLNSWKIYLSYRVPELYSKGYSDLRISKELAIDQNLVRTLINSSPNKKELSKKRETFIDRQTNGLTKPQK